MHMTHTLDERKRIARTAGALYLINIVTGIFSLMYVPSQINVHGDLAATMSNMTESALLFRGGILSGAVCYTVFLLLPLALYRLLGQVNRKAARLMVLFAVISVPIFFIALRDKLDMLSLVTAVDGAFTADQLHTHMRVLLDAYANAWLILELFSGLWLLPFGYLVLKSGFLPKFLGVLLLIGGVSYVVDFAASILVPDYASISFASFTTLPASLGEIATCLWLLLVGARATRDGRSPVP